MTTTLIIPGIRSSGTEHWQSWFEEHIPGAIRVGQHDWDQANLADWTSRVRRHIAHAPGRIFIVAHSFGALAAVQAANDLDDRISGALLVAPADPDKFGIADYLPAKPLAFPNIIVASTNDPWMAFDRAAAWADRWGSELISLGDAGHINIESGYGPWPQGLLILDRLRRAADWKEQISRRISDSTSHERRPHAGRKSVPRPVGRFRHSDQPHPINAAAEFLEQSGWYVSPPARASGIPQSQ